ncbi:hypothetical protein [Ideonella sp.]|jgi:hypothetical protein|uniref:hypothetical protein n=1 Tax=Ideonella sp. TaxID=1929293 RepID=UPI0037C0C1FD
MTTDTPLGKSKDKKPKSDAVKAPKTERVQSFDLGPLKALIPEFPEFRSERAMAFDLERKEALNREMMADDELAQAVLYVWPKASDTLVVLFRGIGRKGAGLPKRRWGNLFQSGVNVLVLNDNSRCFYGRGVELFGTGVDPTLEFIRKLQQALGCTKLLTLGSSAGGSGALSYGVKLGADKILAFSPVTAVKASFYESRDLKAPDSERVVKRWRRLERLMKPADQFDCREVIQASGTKSRIRVHYPTGLYWDRMWGENLQGLPQVELFAHDDVAEHSLLNEAGEQSIAAAEIESFLLA